MALTAIVAAALTTPQTRTLVVFAGGVDVTSDVKWSTFTTTDSGTNAKGTCSFTIEGAASSYPSITDQALVRVEEPADPNPEVFRGFIRARRPGKDPRHPTLEIIADDITSLLDDCFIPVELRQPESMQARIGYLWGKYAGQFLAGDLSFVASVGGTLPLQRFEAVTLRQAIEMTIAQASSTADYYVDMLGRLHIFVTETNDAPFDIDADAPGGGEIAPEMLDVEHDSNAYANRVYVKGATPESSLFVQDEAAIAAANGLVRTAMIQAGDVTTATMAQSLGRMYLGRVKTAKPRGVFVTHSPNDGWRGGQNVLVTSADHALSAQSYRIARVTTKVLKPGADFKRSYRVEFGGAQAGAGIDGQPPLIAGASSGVYMLDQLGSSIVSMAASNTVGAFGAVARRYIMSGVYNGDFFAPPPGPDARINDDDNPLPYWSFVQSSGTAVKATVVEDADAGSGRMLRFDMASGAAGDDAYIEQITPVNAARGQNWSYSSRATVLTDSAVNAMEVYVLGEYLKVDGETVTGTGAENAATTTSIGSSTVRDLGGVPNSGVVPTDAFFLRIRVGFRRDAEANGSSGTVFITEVRNQVGQDAYRFPDAVDPATYNFGRLLQYEGALELLPTGAGGTKSVVVGGSSGTVQISRLRHTPQGAIATRTTTQSITTGTWTGIQFNATDISDPFGFHDPSTNNTRFTVPTGWGGTYMVVIHGALATHAGTSTYLGVGLNGADPASVNDANRYAQTDARMEFTGIYELDAGDYIECMVFHDAGTSRDLLADAYGAIYYLGEAA